jgi:hypothetical protein
MLRQPGQEEEAPEAEPLRSWTDGSTCQVAHEFVNNSDVTLQVGATATKHLISTVIWLSAPTTAATLFTCGVLRLTRNC